MAASGLTWSVSAVLDHKATLTSWQKKQAAQHESLEAALQD